MVNVRGTDGLILNPGAGARMGRHCGQGRHCVQRQGPGWGGTANGGRGIDGPIHHPEAGAQEGQLCGRLQGPG